MTKSEYRDYLASPRWKNLRNDVLSRYGYCCGRCGVPRWLAEIFYDQDLHVHHESYAHLGTDEEIGDLSVLCRRCHEIETWGRTNLRELPFSVCDLCRERHWDPRSNLCELCRSIIGDRGFRFADLLNFPVSDDRKIGEIVIFVIVRRLGIDWIFSAATRMHRWLIEDNKKHGKEAA